MSSFFSSVREALGIAPVDRFTVDYLRHLLGILERNPVVTPSNVEAMVETVRAAARPPVHGTRCRVRSWRGAPGDSAALLSRGGAAARVRRTGRDRSAA